MAGDEAAPSASYSRLMGLVFVFNLIVGTGALTMPKAFQEAGWALSGIILVVLAFISYVTATFVLEAMSISNALKRKKKYDETKPSVRYADMTSSGPLEESLQTLRVRGQSSVDEDESTPLLYGDTRAPPSAQSIQESRDGDLGTIEKFFEITERFELGQMAHSLFNRLGMVLFYLSMCIYLYGDLAVYAAGVPKSLRDVACTYALPRRNDSQPLPSNSTVDVSNRTITDKDPCWPGVNITRMNAYRIFLAIFTLMLCPFVFFNVTKTKHLQLFTTVMRWFAFGVMLVLASIRLFQGKGQGHPHPAVPTATPSLFGVCVYAFMCHHSLPSLITPIKKKKRLPLLLLGDYLLILCFYLSLSYTAIFAFAQLSDLYSLDFEPNPSTVDNGNAGPITKIVFFQYYLALFPVFTLSTNFPIIGITLRNNLIALFTSLFRGRPLHWLLARVGIPLLAVIPPTIIAFVTNNLTLLVGITGSYAGVAIQYLIPAFLVYFARKKASDNFPSDVHYDRRYVQMHRSPFSHVVWVILVLVWAVLAVTLVTANHIMGYD